VKSIFFVVVAVVFSAFSVSCAKVSSKNGSGQSGDLTIQATFGVRNAHEVARFLKVATGVDPITNGTVAGTFTSRKSALSSGTTLNAKNLQAIVDIAYQTFGVVVTNESPAGAAKRWFGDVNFSSNGVTQFTAAKKEAICLNFLTRLMGQKPMATETAACVQTFTEISDVSVAIAGGNATAANRNETLKVFAATLVASTLGGAAL